MLLYINKNYNKALFFTSSRDDDDYQTEIEQINFNLEKDIEIFEFGRRIVKLISPICIYPMKYRLGSDTERIYATLIILDPNINDFEDFSDVKIYEENVGCGGNNCVINYLTFVVTINDNDNIELLDRFNIYVVNQKLDNGSCYCPYEGHPCHELVLDLATCGRLDKERHNKFITRLIQFKNYPKFKFNGDSEWTYETENYINE